MNSDLSRSGKASDLRLAGLLLAAGESSRLGRPKQLVRWQGKPLLQYVLENLEHVCDAGLTLVLGANAAAIRAELQLDEHSVATNPVHVRAALKVVENADWISGMASSIRCGIEAIEPGSADGLLLMVCDQPRVSLQNLRQLAIAWTEQPEVPQAATYAGIAGTPAIFPASMWPQLSTLQQDQGARVLLRQHDGLRVIEMPSAELDIDTEEDLQALVSEVD